MGNANDRADVLGNNPETQKKGNQKGVETNRDGQIKDSAGGGGLCEK